jgi:predicted MFS family arabinose efflux permease
MVILATTLAGDGVRRSRAGIDWLGLVLFTGGMSALLLGLVQAGHGEHATGAGVLIPLAVAAVALTVFVAVERRVAEPIVPFRLFGNRVVLAGAATGFLSGMAMFGAISFIPLFMQGVTGSTATAAGFVLTPFVLGWVALSITSARLVLRVGYRGVVVTGMVCLTAAFVLFSRWDATLTQAGAMRDVLLGGVGMGLVFVPMLIAVQTAVGRGELGAATAMTQFARTVGGTIGLSLMGALMARRLAAGLPVASALHEVFVLGLAVCLLALLSAFLVPAGRAQDLAQAEMRGEPTRVGG